MKRIILLILFFLLAFIMTNINIMAEKTEKISKFEDEIKMILRTASPSILKVVAENHKKNFATGIAIDSNHVVSNIKIIQRPCEEIYIETVKGKQIPAEVVGKDTQSSLLLLKINENTLTPIKQAKSYEVGDWVALVGAFYKEFPSIYQGILSSSLDDQLILNAPVAPGSSGGAVLNKKGELIGVIRGRISFAHSPDYTFKDYSSEIHIESTKSKPKDLCVAVPIEKVSAISNDLKKFGKVKRGWLGVILNSIDGKTMIIEQIIKQSPAEKAGLKTGDTILSINGVTPKNPVEASKIVKTFKPGQKVKMEILRGKSRETALIVIGEYKSDRYRFNYTMSQKSPSFNFHTFIPESSGNLPKFENFVFTLGDNRTLGVDLMRLTPQLAKELNIKQGSGLLISKIYKDTAAEKAGLIASDVIVKAGGNNIESYSDLRKSINQLEDNQALLIEVNRKGKLRKIKVVPDKKEDTFGLLLEKFKEKMKNIAINIDEKGKKRIEQQFIDERLKLNEYHKDYIKEVELLKDIEIKHYKDLVEKLKKEQIKMKEEIERLKKELNNNN